jgi:cell division protein FtsQ
LPEDRSPRRRFERKQRQQSRIRPRIGWRYPLAALSLVLLALTAYGGLQSSLLRVRSVQVSGTETLDSAALVELSGLRGQSMLLLPSEEARRSLLALPHVRAVRIERAWPNGVRIRVEERRPFAYWTVGGRDYVVDREGFVLATGVPSGPAPRVYEHADRVMGPGDRVHPDALAFADRIFRESPRFIGEGVRQLEYRADVGVTAVFDSGMRVTFGDQRAYEYKVAVLAELLGQLQSRGSKPRSVDLRFGERVSYE